MTKTGNKKLVKRYFWASTNLFAFLALIAVIAGVGWSMSPPPLIAGEVTMYKNIGCQCCTRWANRLRSMGHTVTENGVEDLDIIKRRYKVAEKFQGCHTALIGGYVIEGHVPMKEIERLLRERPDAKGLSVPGMPMGSPGMEAPGNIPEPYTVFLMKTDGSSEVYAKY